MRLLLGKAIAVLGIVLLGAAVRLPADSGAPRPLRTDDGVWDGTWVYMNRDINVVVWMRTENGVPQVKLRSLNRNTGEGFETDWDGQASYIHDGWPGTFSLTLTERDANSMKGSWAWSMTMGNRSRVETANLTIYRALDGRSAVFAFEDFKRVRRVDDKVVEIPEHHFWSFRKASARLALWEELPL